MADARQFTEEQLTLERRRSLEQRSLFFTGTSSVTVGLIATVVGLIKPSAVVITGEAKLTLLIATICFVVTAILSFVPTAILGLRTAGVRALNEDNKRSEGILGWAAGLEVIGIAFLGLTALIFALS